MGKLALAILSKKPKLDEENEDKSQDESSEDSEGYEAAAGELLEAFAAKDKAAVAEALKSFITLCSSSEE